MNLKLLIDENAQDKKLVSMLRAEGYNVLTVNEAGLNAQPDSEVLQMAISESRVLLTSDCEDFEILSDTIASEGKRHPGILLIYEHNNPNKDLRDKDIVNAIKNIVETGLDLRNKAIPLHLYNYKQKQSR